MVKNYSKGRNLVLILVTSLYFHKNSFFTVLSLPAFFSLFGNNVKSRRVYGTEYCTEYSTYISQRAYQVNTKIQYYIG